MHAPIFADRVSKVSGRDHNCHFCDVGVTNSSRWYDAPLAETERFVAVPSLGAIVPGWIVVLPRDHSCNFSSSYQDSEYIELLSRLQHALRVFPGHVHTFEHGALEPGSATGCGVDHAHIHIVPLPERLDSAVKLLDAGIIWKALHFNQLEQYVSGVEYLAFADEADIALNEVKVAKLSTPRSQFFRRAIAAMLGVPERFDYRVHDFSENIEATYAAFFRNGEKQKVAV